MWTKTTETPMPNTRPEQDGGVAVAPSAPAATRRPSTPTARNLSCLGSGLEIKGKIEGSEDLQIDGKVEGSISLAGQKLTVGSTGRLNSEVTAREVIVHGNVVGNLFAQDRVEIRKDSSVMGDVKTCRISIEDGAYFKGRIEIDRGKKSTSAEWQSATALVGSEAN